MLSLAGCRTSIEAFKIIFTFSELVTNNVYFPSQNNRRNTTIIHQVLLQFVSQDVHYIRSGKKYCATENCKLVNQSLRNREISEVVTMDIKHQLKTIITRNISLFGNMDFFQPFDINFGSLYKKSSALHNELNKTSSNTIYPITLKSSLWPCLSSVVELILPQVREKQVSIVVLSLWTSSVKPDVNLFMNDCIEQLLDLSTPYYIDNQ